MTKLKTRAGGFGSRLMFAGRSDTHGTAVYDNFGACHGAGSWVAEEQDY